MNKTLIRLVALPVVVIVAGFRLMDLLSAKPTEAEETAAPVSVYTGTSVMSKASYLKLGGLRGKVSNPQTAHLTDDDVDWLLKARKAVNPAKPYAESIARARPLDVLLHATLSPAQKEQVFTAVLPDFDSRDRWGAAGDRIRACDAMETLHDKRGIPLMLPLLRHPDVRVRSRAQRALHSLGYAP